MNIVLLNSRSICIHFLIKFPQNFFSTIDASHSLSQKNASETYESEFNFFVDEWWLITNKQL